MSNYQTIQNEVSEFFRELSELGDCDSLLMTVTRKRMRRSAFLNSYRSSWIAWYHTRYNGVQTLPILIQSLKIALGETPTILSLSLEIAEGFQNGKYRVGLFEETLKHVDQLCNQNRGSKEEEIYWAVNYLFNFIKDHKVGSTEAHLSNVAYDIIEACSDFICKTKGSGAEVDYRAEVSGLFRKQFNFSK